MFLEMVKQLLTSVYQIKKVGFDVYFHITCLLGSRRTQDYRRERKEDSILQGSMARYI